MIETEDRRGDELANENSVLDNNLSNELYKSCALKKRAELNDIALSVGDLVVNLKVSNTELIVAYILFKNPDYEVHKQFIKNIVMSFKTQYGIKSVGDKLGDINTGLLDCYYLLYDVLESFDTAPDKFADLHEEELQLKTAKKDVDF